MHRHAANSAVLHVRHARTRGRQRSGAYRTCSEARSIAVRGISDMPEGAVDRVRGISPGRQNSVHAVLPRFETSPDGGHGAIAGLESPFGAGVCGLWLCGVRGCAWSAGRVERVDIGCRRRSARRVRLRAGAGRQTRPKASCGVDRAIRSHDHAAVPLRGDRERHAAIGSARRCSKSSSSRPVAGCHLLIQKVTTGPIVRSNNTVVPCGK
jgi:hypothetical protein